MRIAKCGIAKRLETRPSTWGNAEFGLQNCSSPVATVFGAPPGSSSFGNFAIRIPQSAFRNPQFLMPPAGRPLRFFK